MDTPVFHSRKEKELFLIKIIEKLSISQPEKDIYSICIEVLDDTAFDDFFNKIRAQIQESTIITF